MSSSYRLFHRKQDIGKRISLLHREQLLSVAMVAQEKGEALARSVEHLAELSRWPLHVLMDEEQGNIGELTERFPSVTFIVFALPATIGAMANVVANECYSTYFYLTRSDLRHSNYELEEALKYLEQSEKPSVITPLLSNRLGEPIPTIQTPLAREHLIDPVSFIPKGALEPTLYPFLGLGLYGRALFQRLRGFDEAIESDYWQTLDFGLRSWLYGYPIYNSPTLQASFFERQFVIEDRSAAVGIKRVHTRALGVRQIKGKNYLRKVRRYQDNHLQEEMRRRLSLYKTDFYQLTEEWKIS
ncbi:MAG: hypothetical protein WC224_06170 [Sphaerochaetaceae bacterium]